MFENVSQRFPLNKVRVLGTRKKSSDDKLGKYGGYYMVIFFGSKNNVQIWPNVQMHYHAIDKCYDFRRVK